MIGSFRESCAGLSEVTTVFWRLTLEKVVFGTRVLVGDQSLFWWLVFVLARRMYQNDYV